MLLRRGFDIFFATELMQWANLLLVTIHGEIAEHVMERLFLVFIYPFQFCTISRCSHSTPHHMDKTVEVLHTTTTYLKERKFYYLDGIFKLIMNIKASLAYKNIQLHSSTRK